MIRSLFAYCTIKGCLKHWQLLAIGLGKKTKKSYQTFTVNLHKNYAYFDYKKGIISLGSTYKEMIKLERYTKK